MRRIFLVGFVGVVCAAGLVLRFATAGDFWLDEALSANIASLPLGEITDALRHDGHPSGYYMLLKIWTGVFGDSDFALRAMSGVFSAGTVPVLWLAVRERFGRNAAIYASVLAACSPFLIRYGSEARMYAVVCFAVALSWWLMERCLKGRQSSALVGLVIAGGLYLHYWMIWLFAVVVVLLVWRARVPRLSEKVAVRVVGIRDGLWACLIAALLFTPWIGVLWTQFNHTGTPWAERARPAEVAVEAIQAIGGGNRFEPVLLGVVLAGLVVLGATALSVTSKTTEVESSDEATNASVSLGWPGRSEAGVIALVVVAALTLGGVVAFVVGSGFEARYAAVVIPFALGLAGRGLAALKPVWAVGALCAVSVFGVAVGIDDALRDRSQGSEVAMAINDAERSASGYETVLTCPDQLAPAVMRYLDVPYAPYTFPRTPIPERVDWYDYSERINAVDPAEAASQALTAAGDGTLWYVMSPGYHGFDRMCEDIAAELNREATALVVVEARTVYEPMTLFRFKPTP